MCQDYEFRQNLKVGDEIDCADLSKIWYNSTILDIIEIDNIKRLKIGNF